MRACDDPCIWSRTNRSDLKVEQHYFDSHDCLKFYNYDQYEVVLFTDRQIHTNTKLSSNNNKGLLTLQIDAPTAGRVCFLELVFH
jgi:hypothetical protein